MRRSAMSLAVAALVAAAVSVGSWIRADSGTGRSGRMVFGSAPFNELLNERLEGGALRLERIEGGAVFHNRLQRIRAQVTTDGLRVTSTNEKEGTGEFELRLARWGRKRSMRPAGPGTLRLDAERDRVQVRRAGLTEFYSNSVEGLRQDFVVDRRPEGAGALQLELSLAGARALPSASGALVRLPNGRELTYDRLRVTDADGTPVAARMELAAADSLVIVVDDADAGYPLTIDPTITDADWRSMGLLPGTDDLVRAVAADGSGNIYVGGDFQIAGDVVANYIAKWDGSSWSALGTGMNGSVWDIAVSGTNVYAGGLFSTAGGSPAQYVAVWDGSSWSGLGGGASGQVRVVAVNGSDVYVGHSQVEHWDGGSWSTLGSISGGVVYALAAASATEVYAGGSFTTADAATVNRVAMWNGGSWSALGTGVDSTVQDLVLWNGDLYAGGAFTLASGVLANNVAKWDTTDLNWSALIIGVDKSVRDLAGAGSYLYAAGDFGIASGVTAKFVARWDGTNWSGMSGGTGGSAMAVAASGSDAYVGGIFLSVGPLGGSIGANRIAKWNVSGWSALGDGMDKPVSALASSGSDVYAGGSFSTAGGVPVARVARWDGSTWSDVAGGVDSIVYAMTSYGSDVYVGGLFSNAGGVGANRVARWDGTQWSALGAGVNNVVYALAATASNVYAAGNFTSPGTRVAEWDGIQWSAMGDGLDDVVRAIAVDGSVVYAGGDFLLSDLTPVLYVAQWDGISWSILGPGLNGPVSALAVSGGNLYVGGDFTATADASVTLNYVARWDGSQWYALGAGMNARVRSLVVAGTDICAGGDFTTAGGSPANCIASWNGVAWSAAGSGTNGAVLALAAIGEDVYAGGSFGLAGGKVSAYAAWADVSAPAVVSIVRAGTDPTSAASVDFTVAFSEPVNGVDAGDFEVYKTASVTGGTVTGVSGGGRVYTVTVGSIGGNGTLRLDVSAAPTVTDGTGRALTGPYTGDESYTIDNTAPSVNSITRVGASPTNAASVDFTVSFSEAVVGFGSSDLTLTGTASGSITGIGGAGGTYTVTVTSVAGEGTLRLDIVSSPTVTDPAGNPLAGPYTSGEVYDVDRVAPSVSSITRVGASPTNAASVDFTVTFSEAVTGFGSDDLTLTGTASGSITGIGGTGDTYTVTVTSVAGEGTLRLDIVPSPTVVDSIGNALAGPYTSGEAYDVDRVAPSVVSMTCADANPTNAASVDFTVTFNEAVVLFGSNDLALTTTGTASGSVTGIAGTGDTYTVTVTSVAGEGTLRLDIVSSPTVDDFIGNPLAGPYTSGEAYDVDRVAPAAPSVLSIADDTNVADDGVTGDDTLVISGTAEPGSSVEVFLDGSLSLGTATADGGGAWSLDVTGTPFVDGTYDLTAVATDPVGNSGTESAALTITVDTVPPDAPVVDGPASATNRMPTWTWQQGASAGTGSYRYQLDSESGVWTETTAEEFTPATDLTLGLHTLYVQEQDLAGNWSASGSLDTNIVAPGSDDGGCGGAGPGTATLAFALLAGLAGLVRRSAARGSR